MRLVIFATVKPSHQDIQGNLNCNFYAHRKFYVLERLLKLCRRQNLDDSKCAYENLEFLKYFESHHAPRFHTNSPCPEPAVFMFFRINEKLVF